MLSVQDRFYEIRKLSPIYYDHDEIDVISKSVDFAIDFNVGEQTNEIICRVCLLNEANTLMHKLAKVARNHYYFR